MVWPVRLVVWPAGPSAALPAPGGGRGPVSLQTSYILISLPPPPRSGPVSGIDEGGKRMRRTLIPPFQLRLARRPLRPVRVPRSAWRRSSAWPRGTQAGPTMVPGRLWQPIIPPPTNSLHPLHPGTVPPRVPASPTREGGVAAGRQGLQTHTQTWVPAPPLGPCSVTEAERGGDRHKC